MPIHASFELAMQNLGEQHKETVLPAMNAIAHEIADQNGGMTYSGDAFAFAMHGERIYGSQQPFAATNATSGYRNLAGRFQYFVGEPILVRGERMLSAGLIMPILIDETWRPSAYEIRSSRRRESLDNYYFEGALTLHVASHDPTTKNIVINPLRLITVQRPTDYVRLPVFDEREAGNALGRFLVGRQQIAGSMEQPALPEQLKIMGRLDDSLTRIRESETVQNLLENAITSTGK